MLEPPSKELHALLTELRLCTPRDFRRCRPRVRRLSHDLPAFDSVWIDALVQARKLTSFQARLLESHQPQRLRLGPCVLLRRLGSGPRCETFLARPIDGHDRCVLKEITLAPEELRPAAQRFDRLLDAWKGAAHPGIVVPHAFTQLEGGDDRPDSRRIVAVSRLVHAPHLAELVIRRGRFPATIVADLGRQLIDAVAALEARGIVHGDVRLSNVRLTAAGVAVLVDAGVSPAIQPQLIVHANLPPETYDGTAPELIGTGNCPTIASDLYALGCLMWQLLAGRPPFPTGDPLAKLAAHQTRPLPDIRQWAPDTPRDLADLIARLTRREPAQRPQSARELLEQWGPPRRSGRRRLQSFRAMFDGTAQRIPDAAPSPAGRWALLLLLLFVVSGAAVSLLDKGARNHMLSLAGRVSRFTGIELPGQPAYTAPVSSDSAPRPSALGAQHGRPSPKVPAGSPSDESRSPQQSLRPFPPPDAEGVITLTGDGPYAAAEITAVGPLTIVGSDGRLPLVSVVDKPLKIWAEKLTLRNVHFRGATVDDPANDRPSPNEERTASPVLLLAQAQDLSITGCSFQPLAAPNSRTQSSAPRAPDSILPSTIAVAWKPLDPVDPAGLNLIVRQTVFTGPLTGIYLAATPRSLQIDNCLKTETGALISLAVPPPGQRELKILVKRTTLRDAGPLLQLHAGHQYRPLGPLDLELFDCVLDIRRATALIETFGRDVPPEWAAALRLHGEGSLFVADVPVAATILDGGNRSPADIGNAQVEGLAAGSFDFARPMSVRPADSQVTDWHAPRRSPSPPGIDATLLRVPAP